jgi:hypothetical protein
VPSGGDGKFRAHDQTPAGALETWRHARRRVAAAATDCRQGSAATPTRRPPADGMIACAEEVMAKVSKLTAYA